MKFWFFKKEDSKSASAQVLETPINPNAKYTLEELKAAYSFAFAEGIVFGMNTNYKSKSFEEWMQEKK